MNIVSIEKKSSDERFDFGAETKEWNLKQIATLMVDFRRGHRDDIGKWCWQVTGFDVDNPRA